MGEIVAPIVVEHDGKDSVADLQFDEDRRQSRVPTITGV
jgi:hypothetical protein